MKHIKGVLATGLAVATLFTMTSCGVKEIPEKDFKSAVKDVMDCDSDDLRSYEGKETGTDYTESYVYYDGEDDDDYNISFYEYEDEEAAKYFFDSRALRYNHYKTHDGVDGKIKIASNYITVDAEVTYYYDEDGSDVYGGIYQAGPYIITVTTNTGKDRDRDVVDDLLDELGLPKPSRA